MQEEDGRLMDEDDDKGLVIDDSRGAEGEDPKAISDDPKPSGKTSDPEAIPSDPEADRPTTSVDPAGGKEVILAPKMSECDDETMRPVAAPVVEARRFQHGGLPAAAAALSVGPKSGTVTRTQARPRTAFQSHPSLINDMMKAIILFLFYFFISNFSRFLLICYLFVSFSIILFLSFCYYFIIITILFF